MLVYVEDFWTCSVLHKHTHTHTHTTTTHTHTQVPMLLKTDMSSGHFSASDRYKLMEERSIEFAFVADQLGCTKLLSAK
jgi:prolyl oligopeptidase PreP (S9A serine peptidase family)